MHALSWLPNGRTFQTPKVSTHDMHADAKGSYRSTASTHVSYLQLVLHLEDGLSRLPQLLRLLIREMNVGDAQDTDPTKLCRQAQEQVPTFNSIEPPCKYGYWVDLPLVSEYGPSQICHRVPNRPRRVPLEADHFVSTADDRFVNIRQGFLFVSDLLFF